ncbi:PREDICTED: uncharacterized protein LOC109238860 [Nicotiana attenuata]|uniref:uncharacterized protein LOC109238860 n=1 Tax=Nicotiana attenuata TaxID=49451 RepID=UPI0009049A00|nr:PREDICTED: uncharacterized protein LOC109238860 [Nicotiana attenuata]
MSPIRAITMLDEGSALATDLLLGKPAKKHVPKVREKEFEKIVAKETTVLILYTVEIGATQFRSSMGKGQDAELEDEAPVQCRGRCHLSRSEEGMLRDDTIMIQ